MKSISRILLIILLIASSKAVNAQNNKAESDTVGVFETMDGEVVHMFNQVELAEERINFMKDKKRWDSVKQKNIKWMIVNDRVFFCLPLRENGSDMQLMEVIALNNHLMLVQYWKLDYFYLIFDTHGAMVMEKRKVFNGGTIGSKRNNEKVIEEMKNNFGRCTELFSAMQKNLDNKDNLAHGISVMQCGEAADIEKIIQELNQKYWTKK